eukprot:6209378-Pleurochrysis_carterae.AAC.2
MSEEDRLLKHEADIAQLHTCMEQTAINIAGTVDALYRGQLWPPHSCKTCFFYVAVTTRPGCVHIYFVCSSAGIFGRKFSVQVDAEHGRTMHRGMSRVYMLVKASSRFRMMTPLL